MRNASFLCFNFSTPAGASIDVSSPSLQKLLLAGSALLLLQRAAAQIRFPNAPAASGVIVLRTAGSTVSLDEYLPSTPDQPWYAQTVSVTGCSLSTAAFQGYGSNSMDGQFATFGCGLNTVCSRNVARLAYTGDVTVTTAYTTTNCSFLPRGTASVNGSQIYASDNGRIFQGLHAGALTAIALGNSYYHSVVYNFSGTPTLFTSGCADFTTCAAGGSVYYSYAAAGGLASTPDDVYNLGLLGVSVPYIGPFVFASNTLLYAGSETTINGTGGLYKFTSATGTVDGLWSPVDFGTGTVRNPTSTSIGVRALAGRWEGDAFILYFTSAATTVNGLWRYDTRFDSSAQYGAGFVQLATAPASNGFRAVFVAPVLATTPSNSPLSTSTQTASLSVGAVASISASASITASNTATISSTRTSTATPTATKPGHFNRPFVTGNVLVQRTSGA